MMIGKSPFRGVQLMRRDADIQQNAVHAADPEIPEHITHVREIGLHHRRGQSPQTAGRLRHGIGILIERNQTAAFQLRGNGESMSAPARRSIEIDPDAVAEASGRLRGLPATRCV